LPLSLLLLACIYTIIVTLTNPVLKCVDSQRIQSMAASRWAVARKETAVFS